MNDEQNKAADMGEPDFEKLRDERCVPVARLVLNDIAAELIPEEDAVEDGKPVIDGRVLGSKMLQHMLDADLNTTTETPYVPQLILTALAGLNATVQAATVFPINEARLNGIARKILANLASEAQSMDLTKKAEVAPEQFDGVKAFLNDLFAAEELTYIEIKYVMDKIFNSFNALQTLTAGSLEDSMRRAEQKLFNVADMSEITMSKLDSILTSPKE